MRLLGHLARLGALFTTLALLLAGCGGQAAPPALTAPSSQAPSAANLPPSRAPATTGASSRTPVATPASPTSAPATTALPYRADWTGGLNGWNGSEGWTTSNGQLLARANADRILAPLDLSQVADYAVEAEIALVQGRYDQFGFVVRVQAEGNAYQIGHDAGDETAFLSVDCCNVLEERPFQPGNDVHRYRIEVRGNSIAVFVDGAPTLSAMDNTYLTGKRVGLFTEGDVQLSVKSFEVVAL